MLLVLLLSFASAVSAAERWKMQYFYDEDRSSLAIHDIVFPSAQRGVAVGIIDADSRPKPVALITSDGGDNWTQVPLKEPGVSLFFLNDSLGWMVSPRGLWQTEESGRSWRKVKAPDGLLRVHFLDAQRGWAVGVRKQVWSTVDGGRRWEKVAAAEEVKSNRDYTTFGWITFATPEVGMIVGWSRPPRRDWQQGLPDWVDPESATLRRQFPTLSLALETRDGGKGWSSTTSSMFGRISRVRLSPEGWGVGLIEFDDAFEFPSEVVFINWKTGKSQPVYHHKERRITDLAAGGPAGPIYLGAVEQSGKLAQTPIASKVRVLKSNNAKDWLEMEVDYRASARRVILATAGLQTWAATDTGMILKLVP